MRQIDDLSSRTSRPRLPPTYTLRWPDEPKPAPRKRGWEVTVRFRAKKPYAFDEGTRLCEAMAIPGRVRIEETSAAAVDFSY